MGSISGFKEYVDKDHPACPLCGGATNRAELRKGKDGKELGKLVRHAVVQECVNCGAQHDPEQGAILRGSN